MRFEVIGKGAYGIVERRTNRQKRSTVTKYQIMPAGGLPVVAVREGAILKRLRHPGIVNVRNIRILTGKDAEDVYVRLGYRPRGDDIHMIEMGSYGLNLRRHVEEHGIIPKEWVVELLDALAYMHDRRIMHRDIKPENILVGCNRLVICDFGLAREFPVVDYDLVHGVPKLTNGVVTSWYRPAEVILGGPYDEKIDVWSLGVMFWEIFRDAPVFPYDDGYLVLLGIMKVFGTPTEATWPGVSSLPHYQALFPQFQSMDNPFYGVQDPVIEKLLRHMVVVCPSKRHTSRACYELLVNTP